MDSSICRNKPNESESAMGTTESISWGDEEYGSITGLYFFGEYEHQFE